MGRRAGPARPTVAVLAAAAALTLLSACASTGGRTHDLPNVGLLPISITFVETPGQLTWAFARPVHVVVLEGEPRRPGFRVAYRATAEQLTDWDARTPVTIDATSSRSFLAALTPEPSRPCRMVYLGAGDKEGRQVCDATGLTSPMSGGAAHGWGFQRAVILVVSTDPIDTTAMVASERWSRLGRRPPGVTGEWAVRPLAWPRRPVQMD